ncbi:MAG: hypothetical protein QOH14_1831, partial [Pseudonocardiales bacterium]|nr:hypothetical protein [Pseudonocardiales bacterium]
MNEPRSTPDEVAAWAVAQPPGGAVLSSLEALDPQRLSDRGWLDYLAAVQRQQSLLSALKHDAVAKRAAADADAAAGRLDTCGVGEVIACALTLSGPAASTLLATATALHRRPATMAMLRAGLCSTAHAVTLAEELYELDEPV